MSFVLHRGTAVACHGWLEHEQSVLNAVAILVRDLSKRLCPTTIPNNCIHFATNHVGGPERFLIEVTDNAMTVRAEDSLGFIYGLLYISEHFLDIKPFWFWMDQEIEPWPSREVAEGVYTQPPPVVRFRGWFINDEVLLSKWSVDGDSELPWRMALEALLRCGGNLVIPGTDKNARKYRKLATDMGLWITHHHAEPLGAVMFLRVYPDLEADYSRHADLFWKLWEESVQAQSGQKTVWCLGFRGQADMPFWVHDTENHYDTDEKRGRLISEVIERQRQLVRRYVENPVFCTNLYGEIMELYAKGHIILDKEIILIYADNGFGKMVSRRQGNHDPRVPSLPASPVVHGGIYYHVSFYDLQAANHITMLPNSVDFVNEELDIAVAKNAVEYWLINCSNIRPHVYFLDALRKKWYGKAVSAQTHSQEFARDYFGGTPAVSDAYLDYSSAMLSFGPESDQHAGEQFYTENPRLLINAFFRDRQACAPGLRWLTGERPLTEQVEYYAGLCRDYLPQISAYYQRCLEVYSTLDGHSQQLFGGTLLLHAALHLFGAQGAALFGDGFRYYESGDYKGAFLLFGQAAECFFAADKCLRDAEYGVWAGFYANECLADYKHTAYMLQRLMGVMRELGDDPSHHLWYREAVFAPKDRQIRTLLVHDNHMTDWELYQAFQRKSFRRPQ